MPLISEVIQEFIAHLASSGRAKSTAQAYAARLHCLDDLAGLRIGTVTYKQLQALPFFLASTGRKSEHTRSTYIQACKTFFQYAVNRGYLPESPAAGLARPSRAAADQEAIRPASMVLCNPQPAEKTSAVLPMPGVSHRIDEFINYLNAQGRAAATIKIYTERLSPLAVYFVGLNLSQVTAGMIDSFISSLRAYYANATVSGYIQACKTFFRFCTMRGYIPGSPASHLRKGKRAAIPKDKVIKRCDLNAMIEYSRAAGMTLEYTLMLFMADTACRAGELQSLNLDDINFTKREAVVRGKSGERILDFTAATAAALEAWLEIRPRTDKEAFFTTREGRISHGRLYHGLEGIAEALHIERHNPHAIRHLVGQSWTDQGASLELIRLKLGHKDITTTAVFYTHQDRERVKRATAKYSLVGAANA